jgi:hypothetical protein
MALYCNVESITTAASSLGKMSFMFSAAVMVLGLSPFKTVLSQQVCEFDQLGGATRHSLVKVRAH